MLIPLIPAPFHDFTRMGFIFLLRGVGEESYIIVYVEIEQGSGFSTRFVDDEVVERVVLRVRGQRKSERTLLPPTWGTIRSSWSMRDCQYIGDT